MADSRPNFLVVVIDAGRAADFPDGATPAPMPFCERLLYESITFPRAVATSPWTIPSHATLFTGLYPWEHGVHLKSDLVLAPEIPRLPALLGESGYRSFSASANGFLCPELGLTEGFDAAAWGEWWERYLRLTKVENPPNALNYEPTQRRRGARGDGYQQNMLKQVLPYSHRFPAVIDGANRIARQVLDPGHPDRGPVVSAWIEPTMRNWLARQPPDAPVFCFVNFMEAHEPFFGDPAFGRSLSAWREMLKVRMDRFSYITGKWEAAPRALDRLHRLYRGMLRFIDSRVEALVRVFRESGRWDNTTFLLLGDHGQAFGEHHHLYHGLLVHDPILRIPLWMRLPDGSGRGRKAVGWAGLTDLAPTLLHQAGHGNGVRTSGFPLTALVDGPRPTPVFAMADGITPTNPLRRMGTPEQKAYYDRVWVAAYQGNRKVVLDAEGGRVSAYDIEGDPGETSNLWPGGGDEVERLVRAGREVGSQILHQPRRSSSASVEQRLASWGY